LNATKNIKRNTKEKEAKIKVERRAWGRGGGRISFFLEEK
jgi:hypothetical protein